MSDNDAYHLHPELRGKIKPPGESFFRDLDLSVIDAHAAEAGEPLDWRTPCEERDTDRRDFLKDRRDQDLWFFAYGSLMWDPSVEFEEVRYAQCDGYQRSFCLWDDGGRGSHEKPGLMLAIDEGGQVGGLAFRIRREKIEDETFVLFRREMLLPVYRPVWLNVDTKTGPIEALGFVANRRHALIRPGISLAQQAYMIAHAKGLLGSNFEYLSDLHARLQLLDVQDPYVTELYDASVALRHGRSTHA